MTSEVAINVSDHTPPSSPGCLTINLQDTLTTANDTSPKPLPHFESTGTPLDLTFKLTTPTTIPSSQSDSPNALLSPSREEQQMSAEMSESLKSLNELANLQKRFIESNEMTQTYADQLQKVANGPTTLISSISTNTTGINSIPHDKTTDIPTSGTQGAPLSSIYPPVSMPDLQQLCQNIPLQYQLAAYSLWTNSLALALANGQNIQATGASPLFPLLPNPFPQQSVFPKQSLNNRDNAFLPYLKDYPYLVNKPQTFNDNGISVTAPPEVFGISMRGNQKYSAYYQKSYHNNQNIEKATENKKNAAADHNTSISSNTSSVTSMTEHKEKGMTKVKETAFVCSCGEEFENLYIFTLHMKDSDHKPRSSQTYRNIPKLVRGQDMWINSETEQTREILRCMHCHQSFPTLPDLTMHMIKTNHYSEIVYSDAGRCLMLNAEETNKKNSEKEKISSSHGKHAFNTTDDKNTRMNNLYKDCLPPKKKSKLSSGESTELSVSSLSSKHNTVFKSSHCTEVTEADSATIDSSTDSNCEKISDSNISSSKQSLPSCSTNVVNNSSSSVSVISQIESFLEKNLPITNKINSVSFNNFNHSKTSQTKKSDERRSQPIVPYIAPPESDNGAENPLSSLQKLVETTHKHGDGSHKSTSSLASNVFNNTELLHKTLKMSPTTTSNVLDSQTHVKEEGSPQAQSSTSPTVIMVNPTYIYQPTFSSSNIPTTSPSSLPWYSRLSMLNSQLAASMTDGSQDDTQSQYVNVEDDDESKFSPNAVDLSRCKSVDQDLVHSSVNLQQHEEQLRALQCKSPSSTTTQQQTVGCRTPNIPTSNGAIVKKAKCNYCGKPFANKGQVRLHVSKGKCPSLLQSCHSSNANMAAALRPNFSNRFPLMPGLLATGLFPYLPADYLERISSQNASLANVTPDERIQRYLSAITPTKNPLL